jgi:hypothetical protein
LYFHITNQLFQAFNIMSRAMNQGWIKHDISQYATTSNLIGPRANQETRLLYFKGFIGSDLPLRMRRNTLDYISWRSHWTFFPAS